MIKKEKVFELKIQEDDELSGIDSISLVDEPAIEVNWVAFKKEVQEDFHIPDGEDETYLSKLLSKGQPEQELLDEGWEIDRVESVKQNFSTSPNDESYQDNSFYRVRYKYSLNSNIKQSAIIPTTRQFCRELIQKNFVWRIEEVENEINSFGQSAQFWRGGYNCRHEWYRIFYKKSGDITNKSSVNRNKITGAGFPIELSPEWLQPNTVTDKTMNNPSKSTVKNLGLSKEKLAEVGPRGGIKESDKAPKSDTPNKNPKGEGSAKGDASGKSAKVTEEQEKTLQNKVDEFNEKESNTKNGRATLGQLKSVFQRGLGAFNTSHSPVVKSAEQWAYARVNAYLYLLKNGRPENPKYNTDYDLLPNDHPKSDMSSDKFVEGCPEATQDVETNLKNRQECIDVANYGPLNPNEPNEEYWKKKADMFGGDLSSAKKALCGNCSFFIKTKSMLDCIANGINDTNEWDTIESGDLGYCEAFDFKCASSRTCDAWVVGGPIVEEDMESVSDYPDSVKNNAKAVLKYVDENGWGSCGTEVGKIRANQLAKGEPISIDTVKRMYSYLSRHEVDLESSKGYGDGCGKLMYDSWGGKSALSWSESKLKNFGYDITTLPVYVDELPKKKKKDMSKQYFATDSEKHIVLGPAMVPDQKIFRKDNEGNPYYVFFSPQTIAMIAQKYMKNKYTDNNDMMHDGKAVDDVHVLESWIKESNNDKSSDYGFENLPVGTWFVSMKINNPEIWDKVKDGTLNGFSVSGFFEEVAKFTKEEMFLYQVAEILKKY